MDAGWIGIELTGLKAWADPDQRPHHVDLRIAVHGHRYGACIAAPAEGEYSLVLLDQQGRVSEEEGGPDGGLWRGSIWDGMVTALLWAIECAETEEARRSKQ